ncbi:hypothetical protein FQN60_000976 [Etheostoma spectabile]|uniref:Ras-related GTP-binding protein n=1 Tax=Etheostoma spectabile TaxID=54343 RepID=A0A5J5D2N1_9PERO|nr:hypothetical protein FQN60_000976 [Etheostoma spectabile]
MSSPAMKKKVLLMGKSGSGKTSMRSIIFANYIARDTRRLGATIDVEHSHVRFLGNLVLNLWDCGGQDTFMENYFTSQRDNIFRNVEVLIYVFDVESRELEKDMHYYQSCLEAILQNSPDAKVFCLVHKMDLVQEDQRDLIFKEREEDLKRLSRPLACTCFRTSIWDETLYKAWSSIVYQLIPNVQQLETNLRNFAQIIEADEVLLFERATFLVISHYQCKEQRDAHRFEKISNIIKQFKLSCSKLAASFQSMEVRNSNFAAFIDVFTSNTYVMVIMSDPSIPSAATLINIRNARKHFEKLEREEQQEPSPPLSVFSSSRPSFIRISRPLSSSTVLAFGYSATASIKSSLERQKRSEYPKLRMLAVLRFPILLPFMFRMLISPKQLPAVRRAYCVTPSSATTASFPSLMIYISFPMSPFLQM